MIKNLIKTKTLHTPTNSASQNSTTGKSRKIPLGNRSANKNYMLCYCSYFAAVFRISEGIKNLVQQTLIEKLACMKNTSSPLYFNLKSG